MLKETPLAIARLEHQFKTVQILDVKHLEIVATNSGRFTDEFMLYFHELQLRRALTDNDNIDIDYARAKMREYAWNIISVYEARELIATHVAAYTIKPYRPDRDKYEKELSRENRTKRYHKQVINKLLGFKHVPT